MNLKLKEGQLIVEHLNDFEGMITQLSIAGLSLNDETQACLLLGSLPDSWNTLVVSLRNSATKGKVTLAMVKKAYLMNKFKGRSLWAHTCPCHGEHGSKQKKMTIWA